MRAYDRAASRYRFLALVYILIAALTPLVLLVSANRPAAAAALTWGLAAPILAGIVLVAAVLCVILVVDVAKILHVKRTARPLGRLTVRHARLGMSPAVGSPTAIGYLHPAIVVPDDFRARVDAGEWEAVLAHESAHLARRDDWAKALQAALLRLGWWLPGLWILGSALDLEREMASDDRAAYGTAARRYAACLLRLATDRWDDAIAPALWGRRTHTAIRVERLLRPTPGSSPVLRAIALGAFTALALVLLGALIAIVPGSGPPGRVAAASPKASRMAFTPTGRQRRRNLPSRPAPATPIASRPLGPLAVQPVAVLAPPAAVLVAPKLPAKPKAPHAVAFLPGAHHRASAPATTRRPPSAKVPSTSPATQSEQPDPNAGSAFDAEIGTHARQWIRFPAPLNP